MTIEPTEKFPCFALKGRWCNETICHTQDNTLYFPGESIIRMYNKVSILPGETKGLITLSDSALAPALLMLSHP